MAIPTTTETLTFMKKALQACLEKHASGVQVHFFSAPNYGAFFLESMEVIPHPAPTLNMGGKFLSPRKISKIISTLDISTENVETFLMDALETKCISSPCCIFKGGVISLPSMQNDLPFIQFHNRTDFQEAA